MRYYIVLIFSVFLACGRDNHPLILFNNSNDDIYYVTTFKNIITDQDLKEINTNGDIFSIEDYQGTGKPKVDTSYYAKIEQDSFRFVLGGGLLEYGFKGPSAKSLIEEKGGEVYIFVLTDSLLKNTSKRDIVNEQIFTKRYKFNTSDLDSLNWKIEFGI